MIEKITIIFDMLLRHFDVIKYWRYKHIILEYV